MGRLRLPSPRNAALAAAAAAAVVFALPLAEAQIGIRVINHGWEFQESDVELQGRIKSGQLKSLQNDSLVDFNQIQVTLGARIEIRIFEIDGQRPIFTQQFFGQWAFLEYADPEFQMSRKGRLYLLHETLMDRAFDSILNEEVRGQLYDGLSIQQKADEAYYLEALSEDWGVLSGECADVAALLPRAFGA